jgi:hypothetical protein
MIGFSCFEILEIVTTFAQASDARALVARPPWSPLVTLLFLTGAVIAIAAIYLRERGPSSRKLRIGLAAIRIGLIVLLLLMLYGIAYRPLRQDRTHLTMLIDNSRSMSAIHPGRGGGRSQTENPHPTRLDAVKSMILGHGGLLEPLRRRFRLKIMTLDGEHNEDATTNAPLAEHIRSLQPTLNTSRLGDRLRNAFAELRGQPSAAVVLFSDGINTEGTPLAAAASAAAVPVHVISLISDRPARDVALVRLNHDEVVFLGDPVTMNLVTRVSGFKGRAVTVALKMAGNSATLAQAMVTPKTDAEDIPIQLVHRPDSAGTFTYQIETRVLTGETDISNNRLTAQVTVYDQSLLVLMIESTPSYEFRFLKMLLERGQTDRTEDGSAPIAVSTLLQDADPEFRQIDRTAVATLWPGRDELNSLDVLILGDVDPSQLPADALEQIVSMVVEQGKSVIFIAGPKHMPHEFLDGPIGALFPFRSESRTPPADESSEYRITLTEIGELLRVTRLVDNTAQNSAIWHQFPPARWIYRPPQLNPGVQILARFTTETTQEAWPAITLHYVGRGQVLFHFFDETWRWNYRQGEAYYARYWLQVIRYLVRQRLTDDKPALLEVEPSEPTLSDVVQFRVRLTDPMTIPTSGGEIWLEVERENGQINRLELDRDERGYGWFAARAPSLPAGEYRVRLVGSTTTTPRAERAFTIRPVQIESTETAPDIDELKRTAKVSGGKYYDETTCRQLLDDLPEGTIERLVSSNEIPFWNSSIIAALFIALITLEWILRKRCGML